MNRKLLEAGVCVQLVILLVGAPKRPAWLPSTAGPWQTRADLTLICHYPIADQSETGREIGLKRLG